MKLEEYTKHYVKDVNFLKEVEKTQSDFLQLSNLATKTEAAKVLIIGKHKAERFVNDCFEVMGEQDIIIEKQSADMKDLKGENKFLLNKLDQEGILYEKELNKFKENYTTLVPHTNTNILQRGYQVLLKKAQRNQKI